MPKQSKASSSADYFSGLDERIIAIASDGSYVAFDLKNDGNLGGFKVFDSNHQEKGQCIIDSSLNNKEISISYIENSTGVPGLLDLGIWHLTKTTGLAKDKDGILSITSVTGGHIWEKFLGPDRQQYGTAVTGTTISCPSKAAYDVSKKKLSSYGWQLRGEKQNQTHFAEAGSSQAATSYDQPYLRSFGEYADQAHENIKDKNLLRLKDSKVDPSKLYIVGIKDDPKDNGTYLYLNNPSSTANYWMKLSAKAEFRHSLEQGYQVDSFSELHEIAKTLSGYKPPKHGR